MRSRSLAFLLTIICGCRLTFGTRREPGIPKCGLSSADEVPITSLIQGTVSLVMHPKIKLDFYFLLPYYIVSFQLTQMQNILYLGCEVIYMSNCLCDVLCICALSTGVYIYSLLHTVLEQTKDQL